MAWDIRLFYLINHDLAHPWLDSVMWWLSATGRGPGILAAIGLVLWICPRLPGRVRMVGATMFAVTVIGLVAEYPMKPLFGRLRPSDVLPDARVLFGSGGYAFPSGHATVAFASAAVLCRLARWMAGPAILLAAAVALSRVYLGNHWPSDVVAGAALGFAFGWWFAGFFPSYLPWPRRKQK